MADDYLECPCCGDVGAEPHTDGDYYDGDPLLCGCNGSVSLDEEGAWIRISDCEECGPDALCHDASAPEGTKR
jgi:hypothetical protein